MPDVPKLLRTIQQATRLFRETPGRRGRFIALQNVTELLVAGDMHGHIDNFRRILQRADLAKHPTRHVVLQELIHGRFRHPDGSDKSHQLIDLLSALKCQYPRQVHMLLGNHELAQWTDRRISKADEDLNALFHQGVRTSYGSHGEEVYRAYINLFANLPMALRTPNRVFLSHSLPRAALINHFELAMIEQEHHPQREWITGGILHGVVWGRDNSLPVVLDYLRRVDSDLLITGHIPCENGYDTPNNRQLILDSAGNWGCYCLFPTTRSLTHAELLGCVHKFDPSRTAS
ncbi:MAG: metallophosphoesterase [Gemmataceae bacterium]